jgi:hypothetical protein
MRMFLDSYTFDTHVQRAPDGQSYRISLFVHGVWALYEAATPDGLIRALEAAGIEVYHSVQARITGPPQKPKRKLTVGRAAKDFLDGPSHSSRYIQARRETVKGMVDEVKRTAPSLVSKS